MNNLMGSNETKEVKIKVTNAEIVVHGTDKPYYEIKYYKLNDEECYIGYGSYELRNVIE